MNERLPELTEASRDIQINLSSVIDDLVNLVNLTEEKYGFIYDNLPVIEQNVKLSIREVEVLLKYLISDARESGARQSVTINTLTGIISDFDAITSVFLHEELINVLQRTFLEQSGEDNLSFSELLRVVQEVEEALATLRDLALNSIIFAIRAGDEGAGFQILSDSINRVSVELGGRFGIMRESVNSLHDWNKKFQRAMVEFIDYEEELQNRYQNKFQMTYQHVVSSLNKVCEVLDSNLDYLKGAFSGVSRIMVMVQNQDIIRQNIENMSKCIRIILEKIDSLTSDSFEECLDHLVFANRVLTLSKTLMENIETSLGESIFCLNSELTKMDADVADLEEDSAQLTELFAGNKNGSGADSVLNSVFDTVSEQLDDLMSIGENIKEKSGVLFSGNNTFTDLIQKVEHEFQAIEKETKGLKKMKVLIKIELARINKESDLSLTAIAAAVDEVVETIHGNQQLFRKLRDHFVQNIEHFSTAVNRIYSRLENSTETLAVAKRKLDIIKQLAVGAVLASHREMAEICTQLKLPGRNLADTNLMSMLTTDIKTKTNQVHNIIQQLQAEIFNRHGITDWEEKEEDLKLLADQFTCFVERKAMKDLTDGAVHDIGTSGGDIVLF